MATILELFKSNKNAIYGTAGSAYIDTRGIVNAPRTAALATSSPNSLADLIGNQVGGAMKGSAKRPSDTIFKSNQPFAKPLTLTAVTKGQSVQDIIEPNTAYYVKSTPAPGSIFAQLAQGASSPAGLATKIAVDAVKNPRRTIKAIKNLSKALKNQLTGEVNGYGTKLSHATELTSDGVWVAGNILSKDRKFSDFAPVYDQDQRGIFVRSSTVDRNKKSTFNNILSTIMEGVKDVNNDKNFYIENHNGIQMPYVLISMYPDKTGKILLPATISGLTETMTPEINSFKYVGSPFNSYKYTGVERIINFDLKLYFVDDVTKNVMIQNLNKLRKLVYPAEKLAAIIYPGKDGESDKYTTALAFNPNLVYLTIYGLYSEVLGIFDSMTFAIDDNTPWPITDETFNGGGSTKPHPSVIDVSLSMKVLETPRVWDNDSESEFEYAGDQTTYFISNKEDDRKTNESNRKKYNTISTEQQQLESAKAFDTGLA